MFSCITINVKQKNNVTETEKGYSRIPEKISVFD